MDTIKNYLEGMFSRLPKTPEVNKAKRELLSMMEDKYSELISEGKTDNEAIGIVISEFGNLDEISETLGIKELTDDLEGDECHMIGIDEAADYIASKRNNSVRIALGVFLCIISSIAPISFSGLWNYSFLSFAIMMILIAVGVVLFVISGSFMSKWNYIKNDPARLDYSASSFVKNERNKFSAPHAIRLAIGILLCIISWIPCVFLDEVLGYSVLANEIISPIVLLLIVAIGVFMIVQCSIELGGYDDLLNLNGKAHYDDNDDVPEYKNAWLDIFMHIFWPLTTCIYLCWSFITFKWYFTWIVWPIAGVLFSGLKFAFREMEK